MPIHPHYCPACDLDFEVITFSVNQPVNSVHEPCGKKAERRFGVPRLVRESTDSAFFAGERTGAGQFGTDPEVVEAYTRPAKEAGVSIQGKMYCSTLARFPGDPRAFVSDRHDIATACQLNGLGNRKLGIEAAPAKPKAQIPVDERLVDGELRALVARGLIDPNEKEMKRDEVREKITPVHRRKFLKDAPPKTVKRPHPGKKKV